MEKITPLKMAMGWIINYDKTITHCFYPTAFLIVCILSSEYVDVDMVKGPQIEELVLNTKFNYTIP